jgi:hypothetical protein
MVRNRRISMKNAKELMLEYTAFSFRDPKKAAGMFAEDGAFELPYLSTFELPTEYRGRDAIAGFFQSVLDIYPGWCGSTPPTRSLRNSKPLRCQAKRDGRFINSSFRGLLPRTERSNCLEKL